MRRLSLHEQETIINFNKAEDIAYIFTYEKTWIKHLEKNLGLKPVKDNGFGGKEYEIDKRRIKMPRAPRHLSANHKAKLAKNLAAGQARKGPSAVTKPIVQVKSAGQPAGVVG
jgi:hypothetical protein